MSGVQLRRQGVRADAPADGNGDVTEQWQCDVCRRLGDTEHMMVDAADLQAHWLSHQRARAVTLAAHPEGVVGVEVWRIPVETTS